MKHRISPREVKVFLPLILCLLLWNNITVSKSNANFAPPHSQIPASYFTHRETRNDHWPMPRKAPVFTDFDGDHRVDVATACLIGDQYGIVINLSSRAEVATLISSMPLEGFALLARDINKDSIPDIVVTNSTAAHPLAVWLGDGNGGFKSADQDRFENEFELTSSTRFESRSDPLTFDCISESSDPTCEKTPTSFQHLVPELNGFVCSQAALHRLWLGYFSLSPRSPPANRLI
jgi:hypothetical protein